MATTFDAFESRVILKDILDGMSRTELFDLAFHLAKTVETPKVIYHGGKDNLGLKLSDSPGHMRRIIMIWLRS